MDPPASKSATPEKRISNVFLSGMKGKKRKNENDQQSAVKRPATLTKTQALATPEFMRQRRIVREIECEKVSVFNDPIHGYIMMSGLCLRIIDTKEFQRLRELKQLGVCDYVYSGATHTRFAHSIGVAHFAEKVLLHLKKNQPELPLSDIDILCVKIAGLCHDLGHGPFSHVFDGVFMKTIRPNEHVRHEDWSVNIFRYLLEKNQINIAKYGLTSQDIIFIEEIIRGTRETNRIGRLRQQYYLYDIVNNLRSGLDVDKLDYFQRDIRHTNVDTTCSDFQRFLEFGRVLRAEPIDEERKQQFDAFYHTNNNNNNQYHQNQFHFNSKTTDSPFQSSTSFSALYQSLGNNLPNNDLLYDYMICYPEKMIGEALQLFMLRFQLHQKVYTHKTVKKVEFMVN
jgi:HD superfamily phosphohydrolase